ncbi:PREDICTED: protein S100-A4 [Thamnophis sirtalis]|uniref:Protein S100 n=1 Tax=Thamnophis sirtalis TaxID=35019 RepID=A0A6I9Y530_9SAUR|nr:PREDICTED: protein S100-A4 [Thamnophis sirtalis]
METPLEEALGVMVETFYKYSAKEGDRYKISRKEMKELLLEEMPNFVKKKKDESTFQKIMSNLDSNKDNQVDFQEYATFLACIAMACNDFFHGFPDKMPRQK